MPGDDTLDLTPLDRARNHGYLQLPIPTMRDAEIADLLTRIGDTRAIPAMMRSLTEGHCEVLRVYAERMASAAVREGDKSLLETGLVALLLTWGSSEAREGLLVLPLFVDAVQRLGLKNRQFVDSVQSELGELACRPFVRFLNRSETDRSLASMGYEVGKDAEGFRYVRNW
jgi:hypothetical protein